jgi:hypothetical protein
VYFRFRGQGVSIFAGRADSRCVATPSPTIAVSYY